MAELRFKFDTVEVDHPQNWRELAIKYQRDEILNGLFTQFTTILEWVGSAYDAIDTAITTGICTTIDVDIEWRCSKFDAFANLFSGIIVLEDLQRDEDNCIINAAVEQFDCVKAFLDKIDYEIDLNIDDSISGDVVMTTPIEEILAPFESQTGVSYAVLVQPDVQGYRVKTMMDFITKFLTDDCLKFTSTFFTTDYIPQIIRIEFTANPANGDTISIRLRDKIYQKEFLCQVVVDTARSFYDDFKNVIVLSSNDDTPEDIFVEPANVTASTPGGGILARIDIKNYHEMEIVSFSAGTGTGSAVIQTAFVNGMEGLFMSNGRLIKSDQTTNRGLHKVTFREVFVELSKLLDLGISFEEIAGDPTLRVEPIDFYLDTTSALTIRNIKGSQTSFDPTKIGPSALLGLQSQNWDAYTFSTGISSIEIQGQNFTDLSFAFISYDCGSAFDRQVDETYYHHFGEKIDTVNSGTGEDDDGNYFIMCEANGPNWDAFKFSFNYFDFASDVAFENWHCYNKIFISDVLPHYHQYTLPALKAGNFSLGTVLQTNEFTAGGVFQITKSGAAATTTEGDGYTNKLWAFTKFISKADFDLIVDSQVITINTGSVPGDDVTTFIIEVEFRVFDGQTQFRLMSK